MDYFVLNVVINTIHSILNNQNVHFDEETMNKADEEIIPYIRENFQYKDSEFKVKHKSLLLNNDKRVFPIVIRYYAICQDNLDLLEKLNDANYNFINSSKSFNFFALDKQMSSKFKERKYIHYLMNNNNVFLSFYRSIRDLSFEEREKIIKDFSDIIKENPDTLKVGEDGSCNYLIKRNIKYLGKDFLVKINKKQRNLLNSFVFKIDSNNALAVKELIIKYPDLDMPNLLLQGVLNKLSTDEIGNMSSKDMILYIDAIKCDMVDRVRDLLIKNPNFDCPEGFIRYEIFGVLNNDTILSLSDDAKRKIANIKYVVLNDAYVFPVKKINKVVAKDKIKSKFEIFSIK